MCMLYISLQCQFTVGALGTVKAPMNVVMKIDYLRAMVQFHGNSDNSFNLLPGEEWGRTTAPLEEVIKYTTSPSIYTPPVDDKLYFETVCLSQFLAYTEFTAALCTAINICPSDLSRIDNRPRRIKALIRNRLRTIAFQEKVKLGKCSICDQWLANSPLRFSPTTCCGKLVHEACWNNPNVCELCDETITFLPCCKCNGVIEGFGTLMEAYELYSSLRLRCCGADIHQVCHRLLLSGLLPTCPICNTPLNADGSTDPRGPGDVFHARRQAEWNRQLRIRKQQHYSSHLVPTESLPL